jgi:hypothetical protein
MRFACLTLGVSALAVTVTMVGARAVAQQPESQPAKKARIVPVVMLKPGETKELLLSTWCTVGLTRSAGLQVGEMKDGRFRVQKEDKDGKRWKAEGVTVEVADFEVAAKAAAAHEHAALKKRGLDAFVVKVAATKEARPGLYDLHIADETCSGNCDTDFRVLVVDK